MIFDKHDDFAYTNEEFYKPTVKNVLTTINGMPHQHFAAGIRVRDIYPELDNYFYKYYLWHGVTWEEFLTTEFRL